MIRFRHIAILVLIAPQTYAASISSPQLGTFYSLPSWAEDSVDASHTPGWNASNTIRRVSAETYSALFAAQEAFRERVWFMTQTPGNPSVSAYDRFTLPMPGSGATTNLSFQFHLRTSKHAFGGGRSNDYDIYRDALKRYGARAVALGTFWKGGGELANSWQQWISSSRIGESSPVFPSFDWMQHDDFVEHVSTNDWTTGGMNWGGRVGNTNGCLAIGALFCPSAYEYQFPASPDGLFSASLFASAPPSLSDTVQSVFGECYPDSVLYSGSESRRMRADRLAAFNQRLALLDRSYGVLGDIPPVETCVTSMVGVARMTRHGTVASGEPGMDITWESGEPEVVTYLQGVGVSDSDGEIVAVSGLSLSDGVGSDSIPVANAGHLAVTISSNVNAYVQSYIEGGHTMPTSGTYLISVSADFTPVDNNHPVAGTVSWSASVDMNDDDYEFIYNGYFSGDEFVSASNTACGVNLSVSGTYQYRRWDTVSRDRLDSYVPLETAVNSGRVKDIELAALWHLAATNIFSTSSVPTANGSWKLDSAVFSSNLYNAPGGFLRSSLASVHSEMNDYLESLSGADPADPSDFALPAVGEKYQAYLSSDLKSLGGRISVSGMSSEGVFTYDGGDVIFFDESSPTNGVAVPNVGWDAAYSVEIDPESFPSSGLDPYSANARSPATVGMGYGVIYRADWDWKALKVSN